MKIRHVLMISVLVVVAVTGGNAALSWHLERQVDAVNQAQAKVRLIARDSSGLMATLQDFLLHASPRALRQWRALQLQLAQTMTEFAAGQQSDASTARQSGDLADIIKALPPEFDTLVAIDAPAEDGMAMALKETLADHLTIETRRISDGVFAISEQLAVNRSALLETQRRAQWLFSVGLFLLALANAAYLWWRVLRPLRTLETTANSVRDGAFDSRNALTTRNELGHLARSFDAMTSALEQRDSQMRAAQRETNLLTDAMNLHSIVSVADRQGIIIDINEPFIEISGYSREEVLGQNHRILNSGVHPPEFWVEVWRTISSGYSWRGEICNKAKDGHLYWVDSMIAPFMGDEGIDKYVSIRTDITQRKHYEQSLHEARLRAEDATQSKGQFLANMSHEIRTPMNAILGMLKLLQNTELDARQQDYAGKTESAAVSLLALINDILDFSKVDAGKLTLDPQPFRVDQLLSDLSVILSAIVGVGGNKKQLDVLFDVAPEVPEVLLADAPRLQQILLNLCSNAIKFTAQGQVVLRMTVLLRNDTSTRIAFAVQDSGIGIAPENQVHIFSGFSQAEASTTRKFGGTGLGLAISQRFVDLMGGTLHLESALGAGSTFSFVLDLPTVTNVPEELRSAGVGLLQPRRVLVIEANPVARNITQRMAQSWGWHAEAVDSGEAALARLDADADPTALPFDVVYLNWHLPGMDGWETARRLRQRSQDGGGAPLQIVMVTSNGRATLEQRTQEEQDCLNGFLVKPVTATMLLDATLQSRAGPAGLRKTRRGGASQRRLSGMRILVVEDNLLNQQVAEELLAAEGGLISLAANGRLGVDAVAAAEPQFDVVLMDLQMPVMDGMAATRAIRQDLGLHQLPIVAMTANAMASDREDCLAAGMTEHVGKPFNLPKLVTLLLQLTGRDDLSSAPEAAAPTLPPSADPAPTGPAPDPADDTIDVAGALARMSGATALYVRAAREFARGMPSVGREFADAQAQDPAQAAMQMHTLKGTAATLGATALSLTAARLEKLCKAAAPNTLGAEVAALHAAALHAQAALDTAIATLQEPVAAQTPPPPVTLNRAMARTTMAELKPLLAQSDLNALQRFAELRPTLDGLPDSLLAPLESALQELDLDAALQACTALEQAL